MDKIYVKVRCYHLPDGTIHPESMEWMDGQVWEITRVLHVASPADHELSGRMPAMLLAHRARRWASENREYGIDR